MAVPARKNGKGDGSVSVPKPKQTPPAADPANPLRLPVTPFPTKSTP